jgi:hypothetical protein
VLLLVAPPNPYIDCAVVVLDVAVVPDIFLFALIDLGREGLEGPMVNKCEESSTKNAVPLEDWRRCDDVRGGM